jgi:hypothetical protein
LPLSGLFFFGSSYHPIGVLMMKVNNPVDPEIENYQGFPSVS